MSAFWLRYGLFRREEQDFTLPEVLTIVAVVGILSSIGVGSWFSMAESRRVDAAANQLAADMRLAHSSATNQLADYHIIYKRNGSSIDCDGNGDGDGDGTEDEPGKYCLVKINASGSDIVESTPRDLPDNTEISASSNLDEVVNALVVNGTTQERALEFDPSGTAKFVGGLISGTTPKITVSVKKQHNPEPRRRSDPLDLEGEN